MEASSEHMSGRTARKMDSTVLDCFTALADDNEKKRIDAGLKLLEHVFIKQSDYEEEGLCTELNYALKRLVRGVASSRPNARKGFFTALVGLFSTFTSIPLHEITSAIKKELHSTNASKSEEAETYTGHILVYGALIRSNLFLNTTAEEHAEIFNRLLECGSKRSFLLLPAHSFLVNLIEKTGKESFENAIWPILKDKVKPLPEENLEMLHFLLLARTLYPVVVKKKFLVTHVGAPEIIHEDTLQICATLLLNVRSGSDYSHPVHEEFAKQLAKSSLLSSFWEKGIETELEKPKDFKKYLAVELFYYVLKYLEDKSQIPDMLTPRFVNLIIKSLERFSKKVIPKHDRVCIRAHEVFVNYMLKTSLKDSPVKDKTIVKMVKKLSFGCGGELMFDRVTGTRVVQNLIYMLKENGVKKVADMFRDVISGTSGKKKGLNEEPRPWTNKERMYACDLYARILGLPAVMQESEWKSEQAQFLLYKGFFLSKDQEQGSTGIGALLADSLRQSFYRVLNQRMSKMEDVRKLLYSLVHQANKLITEGEERLRVPLSEEAMESWEKVVSTSENLNQELEAGKDVTLARVFHTMFLYMGLMLLTDAKLAQDALGELYGCYERVEKEHKEKKKKKKVRKSVGEEEVNEPEWVEVAVELVLSLLSQKSSIPKNVVDMFFANLSPYLTSAALGQITQVLDPAVDDNPLLNSWNDENEENYKKGDTSEDSKSESDEESESDMSDVEDENEAVDDKLRMAVRDALGSAAPLTDTESVDIDEMDEEEGRRLNQALSEAFRMYKSSKLNKKSKKQFKDDRILMHFRIRAIDLLEIYLKSEHLGTQASLASYIDIMLVLFNLLEFCIQDIHQKPLENRVRTCLKKLSSKANVSMQGVTEEMIAEALKRLMEKGEKTSGPIYMDMVPKIVECCTFLVRCSEKLPVKNGKTTSLIEEIYKNALTSFFTKRDCLHQPGLFKSVLEIVWTGNLALLPLLVQFAFDPDVRPFRRNQALFLLTIFFRNRRFRSIPELIKIVAPNLKENEATLSDNSIKLLQSHISEDGVNSVGRGVTQKFIHQLFTVMLTIWNSHSSDNREEMGIDWSSFGQCLVAYRDKFDLSREAKISFNQLARALNIKWVPSQKGVKLTEKGDQSEPEKSSEEEGEEDVEVENDSKSTKQGQKKKNKDKKRKTKNNVAKLKKQTRELRLASLSEGLENVSFAVMKRNADADEGHENSDFEIVVHSNLVNGKSKKKDKFDKRKSDESNEDEKRMVKKKKN